MLITDYSGIFFDYLLLDRPIVFAPFDLKEYLKTNRAFYFDYEKITPGPKANNWQEIIIMIDKVLNGLDSYKKTRQDVNKTFHQYIDGNSSQRVYQEILNRL